VPVLAKAVKHVSLREGVFQYVRRVPIDVKRDPVAWQQHFGGSEWFRKSLGTKKSNDLFLRAEQMRREFERLCSAARRQLATETFASSPNIPEQQLTAQLLAEIREQYRRSTLAPWARQYRMAQQGGAFREEFERIQEEREQNAERWKQLLLEPGARSPNPKYRTPLDMAEDYVRWTRIAAEPGSEALSLITMAIREGAMQGERDIDRLIEGGIPAPFDNINHAQARPGLKKNNEPTIRDAVTLYTTDKALRPKTARDVLRSLDLFEAVVGNKQLRDLTRKDFTSFIGHLAQKQVGGRARESIARGISPATVQKRLTFLRSALNHAIQKGLFEGANPATNIDISAWVKPQDKSVMREKRPFRVAELNRVFEHPWFTGCAASDRDHVPGALRLAGSRFWAPIVALFSGCRASELGGLMLRDIDLDGPFPFFHIRDNQYRPTKGGYARFVPILDGLRTLGFEDYVAQVRSTGSDRLFPDWHAPLRTGGFDKQDAAWSNAKIIRAFNRTVISKCLGDAHSKGTRQEVTFHSFRGAFKSMLGYREHQIPPNIINEVVGHSKSELDKSYVGVVPLEQTYAAIHRCGWPGLILPTSPY
jgi:integrase